MYVFLWIVELRLTLICNFFYYLYVKDLFKSRRLLLSLYYQAESLQEVARREVLCKYVTQSANESMTSLLTT